MVPRRIHLVVAIDRLLVRLLAAAPGRWVVKGGYANQLRRPDDARFTEDLDLKIDAAIETTPELLASGFAVDLADDFSYEVAASPAPMDGPPGGGLRFVVVARLAGTELVRFKVDVSAGDVVVGEFESHFSDPVLERLGFHRSRFAVYPIDQHVAEKLHALTLPRDIENTRARDLVDLAWFIRHFTFRSEAPRDRVHRNLRAPRDASVAAGHRRTAKVVDSTLRELASRARPRRSDACRGRVRGSSLPRAGLLRGRGEAVGSGGPSVDATPMSAAMRVAILGASCHSCSSVSNKVRVRRGWRGSGDGQATTTYSTTSTLEWSAFSRGRNPS